MWLSDLVLFLVASRAWESVFRKPEAVPLPFIRSPLGSYCVCHTCHLRAPSRAQKDDAGGALEGGWGPRGQRLAGGRDLGTLRNSIRSGGLAGHRGQLVAGLDRLWLSGEVSGAWRGFGRLLWLEATVVSQECSHGGLS